MNNNNSFVDFLKHTASQKEVSLVIAKDKTELRELKSTLDQQKFIQLVDHPDFFKYITTPSKIYFMAQSQLPKRVYDFIIQYPTGQIEIFDKEKMRSISMSPIYKDVAVLVLITKEALENTQKSGFQVLENVGLTYQS